MRNPGSLLLSSLHSSLSNLGGRERKEGWRKVAKRRGRRGWELEGGYHCYIIAHGRTQKRTAPPQQRELAAAPRTRPGARIEGETSRSGPAGRSVCLGSTDGASAVSPCRGGSSAAALLFQRGKEGGAWARIQHGRLLTGLRPAAHPCGRGRQGQPREAGPRASSSRSPVSHRPHRPQYEAA